MVLGFVHQTEDDRGSRHAIGIRKTKSCSLGNGYMLRRCVGTSRGVITWVLRGCLLDLVSYSLKGKYHSVRPYWYKFCRLRRRWKLYTPAGSQPSSYFSRNTTARTGRPAFRGVSLRFQEYKEVQCLFTVSSAVGTSPAGKVMQMWHFRLKVRLCGARVEERCPSY